MRRVDPKVYDKQYYLSDCSGYKEFKKSWGKILDPRLKRIVQEIPPVRGLKVLDIGCGRGELVFWAARQGAKEVIGIDYSKSAIKLAKKAKSYYSKKIQERIKFKVMDAKNLDFHKNSIDAVFLVEVLEHLYLEEQKIVFSEIRNVLKKKGFVIVHTAPSRLFNDFTYRIWCYPLSKLLVGISNLLTGGNYPNITKPSEIRTESHKVMHVGELTYFSLRKLIKIGGFKGKIKSTNITVKKPELSWKDKLFNFLVYLYPLSNFPPFNILWGNDFLAILRRRR